MIATACTVLFAAVALLAAGVIWNALMAHAADIAALRARYARGERDYQVSWRIVETPPALVVRDAYPSAIRSIGPRGYEPGPTSLAA